MLKPLSFLALFLASPAFAGEQSLTVNLFDGAPVTVSVRHVGRQAHLVLQPTLGPAIRFRRVLGIPVVGSHEPVEISLEKKNDHSFTIHLDGFDGMHTSFDRAITVLGAEGRLYVTEISESQSKAWDGTVSITRAYELPASRVDVSYFDQEIGLQGAEASASLEACGPELRAFTLEQYDRAGLPACAARIGAGAYDEAERKAREANP